MTDKPAKPAKTAKTAAPDNSQAVTTAVSTLTARIASEDAIVTSQDTSITGLNNSMEGQGILNPPVFSTVGAMTTTLEKRTFEPEALVLSPGILAVLAERQRVINDKGRTAESDDLYVAGELVQAGACYAAIAAGGSGIKARAAWPFDLSSFKPGEPTRDLIKSAQFLIAELDRRARLGDPALIAA